MRDKFKTKKYFEDCIAQLYSLKDRAISWIETGKTPYERIPIMRNSVFGDYISIIYAKYSLEEPIENFVEDYQQALDFMCQSWMVLPMKAYKDGEYFNHYFHSNYENMLRMLSLGVLLHQPQETFITLAKIIDKDEVKDILFEYILKTQIERSPLAEESYSVMQYIPKDFKSLRTAVQEENKTKAAELVDKYFTTDWIKQVNKEGGFNPATDNGYCGYWNFYVAAISYLLDIDVSAFENNLYFPKDLYYYAKEY